MSGPATIDARWLLCPLPVLRLRKELLATQAGTCLRLLATDAMAAIDVPHFCAAAGHLVIDTRQTPDGVYEFIVECGGATQDPISEKN